MTNFLFVNGQVRVLESKLLTTDRLERMVGAKTAEDAFRVMAEIQYAECFDDTLKPQDYSFLIQQGIHETKELIQKGTDNYKGYDIFFQLFDISNLKQAYRLKLLDNKNALEEEDFNENYGFSILGNISFSELNEAVFKGKFGASIPLDFIEVLESIEDLYKEKGEFRFVEYALDKVFAQSVVATARTLKKSFLKDFTTLVIDSLNLRILARTVFIHKEDQLKEAFLPYGTFETQEFESMQTKDGFLRFLESTAFRGIIPKLDDETLIQDYILLFEKGIDAALIRFLEDQASSSINSPAISFSYLEKRLRDARKLRFIMSAKFQGLEPASIHETLKTF